MALADNMATNLFSQWSADCLKCVSKPYMSRINSGQWVRQVNKPQIYSIYLTRNLFRTVCAAGMNYNQLKLLVVERRAITRQPGFGGHI